MNRSLVFGILACVLLTACAESKTLPRTQVTLVVRGVDGVEEDAARVRITFRTGPSRSALTEADSDQVFGDGKKAGSVDWPVSMALLRSSDALFFEARIVATDADGETIARRVVQSGFVIDDTKLLLVVLEPLSTACRDADCEEGQNCDDDGSSAECVDPDFLDPKKLPDFGGMLGDGGMMVVMCDDGADADCGDHGTCIIVGDVPACDCDRGYSGDACDRCASGFSEVGDECVEGTVCDPSSSSDDCGANSSCSDATDPPTCVCDSGYQDNDGDGSCAPTCATADLSCPDGAECEDDSGMAKCACPDGLQDNDGNGTCTPTCETTDLSCSAHASCSDADGTASCACDSDYQDNDDNGSCLEACSLFGLACPDNAICDDADGSAACICNEGYIGADCTMCAPNYQDKDVDGVCAPGCGMVDCSGVGSCDDASGTAVCTCNFGYDGENCEMCAVGYGRTADPDMCQWEDVIRSGDFSDPSQWTVMGSASIDGAGWGELDNDALCFGGAVVQTVTMPEYAKTFPLVLKFRARRGSTAGDTPTAGVFVNGVMHLIKLGSGTNFGDNAICIGERGYGGDVNIAFTNITAPSSCSFDPVHIDDVRIDVAAPDQCPPFNVVVNGDFGMDGAGWTTTGTASYTGNDAVISGGACGGGASIEREVLIGAPASYPNAAVVFEHSWMGVNTSGNNSAGTGKVSVVAQGQQLAQIPVPGSVGSAQVCLPLWARGGSELLSFRFSANCSTCYCADSFNAHIDNVGLRSDPACPDEPILDPGFEGLALPMGLTPWTFTTGGSNPLPAIKNDPANAYQGNGYLLLGMQYPCYSLRASQYVLTPPPDPSGGPAMKFWYFLEAVTSANGRRFNACAGASCKELTVNADWSEEVLCINPSLAGKPVSVEFSGYSGSGTCANAYPLEDLWVDAVMLTHDASCPK